MPSPLASLRVLTPPPVAAAPAAPAPAPRRAPAWDGWLWLPAATLVGLGLVLIYSSSAIWAARQHGRGTHFLGLQAAWAALGTVGLVGLARLPEPLLRRRAGWLFVAAQAAAVAVLVPGIGTWAGGARRWLRLGRLSVQPAEGLKLATVILVAALLARQVRLGAEAGRRPRLWPVGAWAQLPVVTILLEPDLGSAVVLELVVVAMLFAAGLRPRTLVVSALAALPCLYHLVVATPFRLRRLLSYVDPWAFRRTSGYQITESLISIGSGGLGGLGLGQGRQKLFFLPEAHTDFIFAGLGEELGLAGGVVTLGLFALLVGRGLYWSQQVHGGFDRMLALGLSLLLAVPAATNVAVATGLVPTKGLPLPLVSYGGSHLIVCMGAVGLLIGVARRAPGTDRSTH